MELNNLKKLNSWERKNKRVGRGGGSGKGWHTTGKGNKGQKARSGRTIPAGFEGGQVQMFKKMPQMGGFKNGCAKRILDLPLSMLNNFEDGQTVNRKELQKLGILNRSYKGKIKFLDSGELTKKLNLEGFLFSTAAKEKAVKAGATLIDA